MRRPKWRYDPTTPNLFHAKLRRKKEWPVRKHFDPRYLMLHGFKSHIRYSCHSQPHRISICFDATYSWQYCHSTVALILRNKAFHGHIGSQLNMLRRLLGRWCLLSCTRGDIFDGGCRDPRFPCGAFTGARWCWRLGPVAATMESRRMTLDLSRSMGYSSSKLPSWDISRDPRTSLFTSCFKRAEPHKCRRIEYSGDAWYSSGFSMHGGRCTLTIHHIGYKFQTNMNTCSQDCPLQVVICHVSSLSVGSYGCQDIRAMIKFSWTLSSVLFKCLPIPQTSGKIESPVSEDNGCLIETSVVFGSSHMADSFNRHVAGFWIQTLVSTRNTTTGMNGGIMPGGRGPRMQQYQFDTLLKGTWAECTKRVKNYLTRCPQN